jgi:hypothetical protein
MSVGKRARWARLRALAMTVGILTIIGAGYAVLPRHPDLRVFDPGAMARSETIMWRHYYERRYISLFADLYDNSRTQYGFSPWDSVKIAAAAARAARAFQPSTSRTAAQVALPFLEEYFGLLAHATPVPLDIEATARAELEWWQARREAIAPQTYGAMIARVSTLLYGRDSEKLREAGVLRAEAMAYRDARDGAIVDADWLAIEKRLTAAYEILKREVSNWPPGT